MKRFSTLPSLLAFLLSALALAPALALAQPAPPPATPSSVTVTRADGTVTANWDAPSGATKYHVTYTTDNGASWSLAALEHTTNSITISGADNTKTYIVGVRAGNDHGWSGWTNSPSAGPYTPPQSPPGSVASVTLTRSNGTVTASWDAISGATKYHVTYTTDNGGSWSLAALNHTESSITINGADNGKTYIVGVRAGNDGGWSGWVNSPASGPYTPPTGTDYDTDDDGLIEISSVAQLDAIRYDLDGNGTVSAGDLSTYQAAYPNPAADMGCPNSGCIGYELSTDLDLSGQNWMPIDASDDGHGYSATFDGNDFTLSNLYINRPTTDAVGLFGSTAPSAVISNVVLNSVSVTANNDVGSLIGYNNGGTITDSTNSGTVTGEEYVGGLVGYNDIGTITDSTNSGTVTGTSYVGGLVGYNDIGTITDSTNSGTVTGTSYVGGLVGYNDGGPINVGGTITNSTNSGRVTGGGSVGGLVGLNDGGTITDSTNSGTVTAFGGNFVGGLVGLNDGGTITDSVNSGNVTGEEDVGGLVGWNDTAGTITNSTNSGNVTGDYFAGGLIGWNESGPITDSTNSGNVTGRRDVGGLAGFNRGTITNSNSSSNVTGEESVGGLVGDNAGTITDSTSAGHVTAFKNFGALAGSNSGTITNSLALVTLTQLPAIALASVSDAGLVWWEYELDSGVSFSYVQVRWIEKPDSGSPNWGNATKHLIWGADESSYQITGLTPGTEYAVRLFIGLSDGGAFKQIKVDAGTFTASGSAS